MQQLTDALLTSTSANLKVEDLRSNSNGSSLLVDVLMPQEMLCNVWRWMLRFWKKIWEWIRFVLIVGLFVFDFFYTEYGTYTIYIHLLCVFSFAASIALNDVFWQLYEHELIPLKTRDRDIQETFVEILGTMDHIYIQTITWLPNLCHSRTVIYHFLDLTFDWICYFDSSIGPKFKRKGFSSPRSRPTKGVSSVWWPSRWSWRGFWACSIGYSWGGAMFGCMPVQKCRSNDLSIRSLQLPFTFDRKWDTNAYKVTNCAVLLGLHGHVTSVLFWHAYAQKCEISYMAALSTLKLAWGTSGNPNPLANWRLRGDE